MKYLKTTLRVAALACASVSLSAHAAAISFTNPDFETGDLSGWSTIGSVVATPSTSVTTFDATVWSIIAAGTNMAQLQSQGASVEDVESALGVTAGTLNALNTNPDDGLLTNASALYQTFTGFAGDTISFAWNYVATDYIPFNDPAFALLIGGSGTVVDVLASIQGLGVNVGTSGNSGWLSYNATLATDGDYTLAFVTTNDKDTILNSYLHIDATAGTCEPSCPPFAVPEPGMLTLFGLGLFGLGAARRFRRS